MHLFPITALDECPLDVSVDCRVLIPLEALAFSVQAVPWLGGPGVDFGLEGVTVLLN